VGENTDRWEDLVRLLQTLSEEELAAVHNFVEKLTSHKMAVQEAHAPYVVPTATDVETSPDKIEHWTSLELATPDELLDFLASGAPGFLSGELDQLLADIEQTREMELETLFHFINGLTLANWLET